MNAINTCFSFEHFPDRVYKAHKVLCIELHDVTPRADRLAAGVEPLYLAGIMQSSHLHKTTASLLLEYT